MYFAYLLSFNLKVPVVKIFYALLNINLNYNGVGNTKHCESFEFPSVLLQKILYHLSQFFIERQKESLTFVEQVFNQLFLFFRETSFVTRA
jgi:hypothetical protein